MSSKTIEVGYLPFENGSCRNTAHNFQYYRYMLVNDYYGGQKEYERAKRRGHTKIKKVKITIEEL